MRSDDMHNPSTAPEVLATACRLTSPDLQEAWARELEAGGAYRVLRRLQSCLADGDVSHEGTQLALFVDVETTGLDPEVDEIIEMACVPFRFDPQGRITSVLRPVVQLREPSRPIPPEVTRLTGIDHDRVRGRAIEPTAFTDLLRDASWVVAHNARFDRSFVERLLPDYVRARWACSMAEVDWRSEGAGALRLEGLAADAGFFYEAHRAEDDCLAAIELLARPLRRSGRLALAVLLENASRDTQRIWAVGAPFEARRLLKNRGYRWHPGGNGRSKCWHLDVADDLVEVEAAWLRAEVFGYDVALPTSRLTAFDRHSVRG